MGKCLFHLKKYEECVKTFTELVQQYPKHPDLADGLYFVARCYEIQGDTEKAAGLYKKILSMVAEHDSVTRKVKKALRKLEGA
jgi:TolA-binding protein